MVIWTKNKSRECTNSQACLVLISLYISFFSWTNTKKFRYRACTSLHRLQKLRSTGYCTEPCILDGTKDVRLCAEREANAPDRPSPGLLDKGLGYAGAAEKEGKRVTARTGTAPRRGGWCRRRRRTWRAAGHRRCSTPPARSPSSLRCTAAGPRPVGSARLSRSFVLAT